MKLIASTQTDFSNVFYTLPDTALRQGGQPFFIPDIDGRCCGTLMLAVRVCRQGRCVGQQFARRYFDAVTCAVAFTKTKHLHHLQERGLPWAEAVGFDGSVCVGRFNSVDMLPIIATDHSYDLTVSVEKKEQAHSQICLADIETFITKASRHFTLHQGDYLLVGNGTTDTCFTVIQDVRVEATIDENISLSFNVK